jgi:hypothetical protein
MFLTFLLINIVYAFFVSPKHITSHIICLITLQTVIGIYPAQNGEYVGNVKCFEISFTQSGSIKTFSIEEYRV